MNPSPRTLLFTCLFFAFSLNSCLRRAYYQHPVQGNIPTYHVVPVGSDSLPSATYFSSNLSLGGMNENLRDNVLSLQAGLHRSHAISNIRLFYGVSAALGSYNVKSYDPGSYTEFNTDAINQHAGTKLWGAYGAYGGVSASKRMGRRGEWRVLGLEGNLYNEFGDYYPFRKNLPDTAATTIDRNKYIGSLGLSTELVFKGRSGNKFGMKFAFGSYLRSLNRHYLNSTNYVTDDNLFYFSNTYNFTFQKTTTYVQLNIATHAANVQFGVNYRL